jgi:hypothetical protein
VRDPAAAAGLGEDAPLARVVEDLEPLNQEHRGTAGPAGGADAGTLPDPWPGRGASSSAAGFGAHPSSAAA